MKELGTKEKKFMKFKACFLLTLAFIFLLYYILITAYSGFGLSMGWFWPLLSVICIIRAIILALQILGMIEISHPLWFRIICRTLVVAFLASFIIVEGMVLNDMTAEDANEVDYIIVLGAKVHPDGRASRPLQARLNKALEYALANPNVIIIASGGQGRDETISEAQCIKNYLVNNGVDAGRILIEDKSTSTIENLKFSYALIPNDSANVAIVTNGFHIHRAKTIAKKLGHSNLYSLSAKTLFPVGPHYVVREYFGMIKELLT